MSYYSSPRWTAEVADCSMPMTFDTYSNCSFGCMYCFSQFQRGIGLAAKSYLSKEVTAVSVERIKKMFEDPDNYAGQFKDYIKQRRVMQWGGLSDQFDGFERKCGKTLELLRFFKSINYPLCFSTKSVWWTKDERYMELFRGQKNWNVKFSIITLDEEKARIIERGVPSPEERLSAIGRIAQVGCGGATLRLRPFIIGVSSPSYPELITKAALNGASAMSTEFFCLDVRSNSLRAVLPTMSKLAGYDILEFYKKYSVSQGYLRLNRKIKEGYIDKMQALCRKLGMRFYVSDAHFKERCDNGSCCGLPSNWNYSKGQFCEALQIAKRKGKVTWDDIKTDAESLMSKFEMVKACGFNTKSSEFRAKFLGMSMAEYLRYLWNNPQAGQSPYKMFEGIISPQGKDDNGNLIYTYHGDTDI